MTTETEAIAEAERLLARIQQLRREHKEELNACGFYLLARCERTAEKNLHRLQQEDDDPMQAYYDMADESLGQDISSEGASL